MKKTDRKPLIWFLADFGLLNIAIAGMQIYKRDTLIPNLFYLKIFLVFYAVWLAASILTGKFRRIQHRAFYDNFTLILRSNIIFTFVISFIVVGVALMQLSRLQTYGTCFLFFLLEAAGILVYSVAAGQTINWRRPKVSYLDTYRQEISYPLLIIDGFLLFVGFELVNFLKIKTLEIPNKYDLAMLLIYGLWLASSLITRKFDRNNFNSYYDAISPCVKSAVFMMALLAVVVFAFRLFYFSRLRIFGSVALLLAFEFGLFFIYSIYYKYYRHGADIESIEEVKAILQRQAQPDRLPETKSVATTDPVEDRLQDILDLYGSDLFEFVGGNIDLSKIGKNETAVVSANDLINVRIHAHGSLRLFINLHKMNDIRYMNRYLLEAHQKLKTGGYLIGMAHTIATHHRHFVERYSSYLADILYAIDFVWHRIFPKLPWIKAFYFTMSRGLNRIISKAEILGRLYFCGFKVIAETEDRNRFFFIAQKDMPPSRDLNPTYGPIAGLNRIGYQGRMIRVYKFRTMHPYSEYLQNYIYERFQLKNGGKFADDFRIPAWGRFLRKYWIDELPMLLNWIKGDMKLFGVRPLSRQYFDLYSDELKSLRVKLKPGLIPPFYADMPATLDAVMESEFRYFKAYSKSPLTTQIRYFFKAVFNIVFRGARSG